MKKYYKIKEIADLYGIKPDSLRYYEEIGLIHPLRSNNNYRLYTLSDIWTLNVIRDCLKLGYDTKQIKKYLENRTIDSTLLFLQEQQDMILNQIQALQEQLINIKKRQKGIQQATSYPCNQFEIHHFEKRYGCYLKQQINSEEAVDYLLTKLSEEMNQEISVIGNLDTGSLIQLSNNESIYTNVFIIGNQEQYDFILEEGDYCTYTYHGPYDHTNAIILEMKDYLNNHGYECNNIFLEFLLIDIHETKKEEEYITQIQAKVKKL